MDRKNKKKVLIIQENGHHVRNRDFRECFSLKRAIETYQVDADVWGKGHENFARPLKSIVDDYDAVISLENYDTGWHPDLSEIKIPKAFWCIDAHMGLERYLNFVKQNRFDLVFNSTRKFVHDFKPITGESIWLPNAYDSFLIDKLFNIPKSTPLGFCGNIVNRGQMIAYLKKRYGLKHDRMVIGQDMVRAINSYQIHWNQNISIDINYRNFETLGCRTFLLTNYVPDLECLFNEEEHLCVYRSKRELDEKLDFYLKHAKEREYIAKCGNLHVRNHHTYINRAKTLLEKLGVYDDNLMASIQPYIIDRATQKLINNRTFLFVSGATKSGTTLLANVLNCSDKIAMLKNSDGKIEEGQWNQDVYAWGSGNQDLKEEYHYTEKHALITAANRLRLFRCWSLLWDLSKPVLAEKSPHNIIKTRFLKRMFPNSKFVVIIRNGIVQATGEALQEKKDPITCCHEWVAAYRFFCNDSKYLDNCLVIRYEELTHRVDSTLRKLWEFIEVPPVDVKDKSFLVHAFKNGVKRSSVNKIKDMNRSHFENFLSKFDVRIQNEMLDVCYPTLKKFGYNVNHETIKAYMETEDHQILLSPAWGFETIRN